MPRMGYTKAWAQSSCGYSASAPQQREALSPAVHLHGRHTTQHITSQHPRPGLSPAAKLPAMASPKHLSSKPQSRHHVAARSKLLTSRPYHEQNFSRRSRDLKSPQAVSQRARLQEDRFDEALNQVDDISWRAATGIAHRSQLLFVANDESLLSNRSRESQREKGASVVSSWTPTSEAPGLLSRRRERAHLQVRAK